VIDAHNYATFAPLLFEAAVGVIVPEDVAWPIRSFLDRRGHATFRLGEVVGIDWAHRRVELADGRELPFDYLIFAPGVVRWYGAMPGARLLAVELGDRLLPGFAGFVMTDRTASVTVGDRHAAPLARRTPKAWAAMP